MSHGGKHTNWFGTMTLFDRYIKVDLIRNSKSRLQSAGLVESTDAFGNTYVEDLLMQERLSVSNELKTEITVRTKQGEDTDYGSVKIYNPNQRTISFIQPNVGGTIEIVAGYGERHGLIFRGNVGGTNQIYVERSGPDIIMTLQLGAYSNWMQNAFFRKAFAGQTHVENIIRAALDQNGIPHIGLHESFLFATNGPSSVYKQILLTDFSWSGKVTDLISHMMKERGLSLMGITATPKDGFWVFSNGNPLRQRYYHVNADTGLLDTPRWKTVDKNKVFTFKSMMNPDIITGSAIEITSSVDPAINGRYTVTKVDYDLSNYDGSFEMSVEAVPRRTFTEIVG